MKTRVNHFILLALLAGIAQNVSAQGTAFTYQGRLNDNDNPAAGTYELKFTLFSVSGGGSATAGPVTNGTTAVSNGLFTVTLDFGSGAFPGADRWLEIGVRTNGALVDFTTLTPRQELTPTPYAIRAANFSGVINDGQLSGNVARLNSSSLTFTGAVSFPNLSNSFRGAFTGDASALTNLLLLNVNSQGAIRFPSLFNLAASPGLQGGGPPATVATADVNGDGSRDLISGASGAASTNVSVLTNNGSGIFTLSSTPFVGGQTAAIATGDVNGDGKADLIVGNLTNGYAMLSVLTNNGSGGFALKFRTAITNQVGAPYPIESLFSIVTADVNADGRIDLVVASPHVHTPDVPSGRVSVFTNTGAGDFKLSSQPYAGGNPYYTATTDVNNDGRIDLVTADFAGNVGIHTNNGSGSFSLASFLFLPAPTSVATADVNTDGRMDLIVTDASADSLFVLTNSGNSVFQIAAQLPASAYPWSVAAADLNRDGKVDLVAAALNSAVLTLYTNNGSGGFVLFAPPINAPGYLFVVAAELNEDGHNDFVTINPFSSSLTVLLQDATYPLVNFTGYFSGDAGGVTNLNASALAIGTVPDAVLSTNVVLKNATNTFSGVNNFTNSANSFSGNGTGLTNVNATSLNGLVASNFWNLAGNMGTTSGVSFLGTTDDQPLELKVNNQRGLRLEPNLNGSPNLIGGSSVNFVSPGTIGATIGGGGTTNYFGFAATNSIAGNFGTISGGGGNTILQPNANFTTIGGGGFHTIQPNAFAATIGGGYQNLIQSNAQYTTLSGGLQNTIQTNAYAATIGGGFANVIQTNGDFATIPGGRENSAINYAFAAGRRAKAIHTGAFVWADSTNADFASTSSNQFLIRASGGVGIGKNNPATALDVNGTVTAIGFSGNEAGLTNLNANNLATGTVADARLSANIALLTGNQTFTGTKNFNNEVAATSGVRINNTNLWFKGDNNHGLGWYGSGRAFAGSSAIDGPVLFGFSGGALATEQFGTEHIAVQWTATAVTVNGTFNNNSDRNAKEHFSAVSPAEILEKVMQLPVTEWSYKTDTATRHIGPMAQDFYSSFNVGTDEKHIAPIDESGVALVAIQGLNQKVEATLKEKDARITALETELARLKQLVEALANRKN